MRNIIHQHNIFRQNMAIVPIVNIYNDEKDNVKKLFESSLYFSGFEPTRKVSEGMYLLVTNISVLNKAQNEADNLLQLFCGKRQSTPNKNLPKRKKRPLIHNQVSSYAVALSQNASKTPPQSMICFPLYYKRPVFISFTSEPINLKKKLTLPHPNLLPHLTSLLLHRFLRRQHRNVKYKPIHHQSSSQLQMTPLITS